MKPNEKTPPKEKAAKENNFVHPAGEKPKDWEHPAGEKAKDWEHPSTPIKEEE